MPHLQKSKGTWIIKLTDCIEKTSYIIEKELSLLDGPSVRARVALNRWGELYAYTDRLITPYELKKRYKPIIFDYGDLFKQTYGYYIQKMANAGDSVFKLLENYRDDVYNKGY